ncbi:MAG: BON domain-containing protein [Bacteroidetes bacterium]|nr:BON domain-containing protein [Bacteroidota bacterium]
MKSYIEIIKEIQDELKWDPDLFESEIQIKLDDGIITLTGAVESAERKKMAESVTAKIEGVKSVINNLEVKEVKNKRSKPKEVPSPNSGEPDNTLKISGA